MIGRVISTSVRQGFGGGPGFQQVLRTKGLVPVVCERAEQLSGYEHPFDPGDARNPIRFFHKIATLQGKRWHFLGRVSDAATDYSGRSNRLSQVLVLDEDEIRHLGCGPAAVLQGFAWEQGWGDDRQPQLEDTCPSPRPTSHSKTPCQEWLETCGDPGWGGELAKAANENQRVSLVVGPTDKTLRLFAEAMELLPPEKRWQVDFSTWEHAAAGLGWRAVRSDIKRPKASVDTAAKTYDLASIKADGLTPPNKHSVFVRTARGKALEVPLQPGIIEEKGGGGADPRGVPPPLETKNEGQGAETADTLADRAARDAAKKIAEARRAQSGDLDAARQAALSALKVVSPYAGVNPACRRMEERAAELLACIERKIKQRRKNLVFWFVAPSLFIALSICAISLGHLLRYWYPSEDTRARGSSTERADGLSRTFAQSQSVPSHDDGDIDSASRDSGKKATGKASVDNRATSDNDEEKGAPGKGEAGASSSGAMPQKDKTKGGKSEDQLANESRRNGIKSIVQTPELLSLPDLNNHEPVSLGIPWHAEMTRALPNPFALTPRVKLNWGRPDEVENAPGTYKFLGYKIEPLEESSGGWVVKYEWARQTGEAATPIADIVIKENGLCWRWRADIKKHAAASVLFADLTVSLGDDTPKRFYFIKSQPAARTQKTLGELFDSKAIIDVRQQIEECTKTVEGQGSLSLAWDVLVQAGVAEQFRRRFYFESENLSPLAASPIELFQEKGSKALLQKELADGEPLALTLTVQERSLSNRDGCGAEVNVLIRWKPGKKEVFGLAASDLASLSEQAVKEGVERWFLSSGPRRREEIVNVNQGIEWCNTNELDLLADGENIQGLADQGELLRRANCLIVAYGFNGYIKKPSVALAGRLVDFKVKYDPLIKGLSIYGDFKSNAKVGTLPRRNAFIKSWKEESVLEEIRNLLSEYKNEIQAELEKAKKDCQNVVELSSKIKELLATEVEFWMTVDTPADSPENDGEAEQVSAFQLIGE